MKNVLLILCLLSGGFAFAQQTSTVQAKPKTQNTATVQTDPAGKEKEYMSIEEYERKYPQPLKEPATTDTSKTIIYTIVEEQAEFPGGVVAMSEFIRKTIVYPPNAIKNNLQGKCFLKFIVNETGEVADISVIKGVPGCPECDEAAIEVVKRMPVWKAAKINGKNVKCYFNLPFMFKL